MTRSDNLAPLIARAVNRDEPFVYATDDTLERADLTAAIAMGHALAGRDVEVRVPVAGDVHEMLRIVLAGRDRDDESASAYTEPDAASVRVAGRTVHIHAADSAYGRGLPSDVALVIYDAHRISGDDFADSYRGGRTCVIGAWPRPAWFAELLAHYEEAEQ